jgi:large subunit ribosomal protein L21
MHAIVEIAGKQFRVTNNEKIKVPLLESKEGEKINFDKVLGLEEEGGKITFGSPLIKNMSVSATVIEHGRDKKIIVFKKKRRKGYQKKNGHKQRFSVIEINTIGASAKKSAVTEKTSKTAEKVVAKKTEAKTVKKVATKKETSTTKAAPKKVAAKTKAAPKKETTAEKAKTTKPKTAAKKAAPKTKAKED